jgi:hypothetical protein
MKASAAWNAYARKVVRERDEEVRERPERERDRLIEEYEHCDHWLFVDGVCLICGAYLWGESKKLE